LHNEDKNRNIENKMVSVDLCRVKVLNAYFSYQLNIQCQTQMHWWWEK